MPRLSPRLLRVLLNLYPPYIGAGVRVKSISSDWSKMQVSMKLRWYNRNAYGTHFGGSLYSMVDPHLVLLIFHKLNGGYTIWDKSASIDFIKPGKGEVTCAIELSESDIQQIKKETETGKPHYPEFTLHIRATDGSLVAKVTKTIYVRKKASARQS